MLGTPSSVPANVSSLLLVSPYVQDHISLKNIFYASRWQVQGAWKASDALKTIRRGHSDISVVICEHRLPDGDWKLLLAALDNPEVRPSLIVCSRLADESQWMEVLKLGAFDLLRSAPFEPEEVLRVTENAWSARQVPAHSGAMSAAAGSRV